MLLEQKICLKLHFNALRGKSVKKHIEFGEQDVRFTSLFNPSLCDNNELKLGLFVTSKLR